MGIKVDEELTTKKTFQHILPGEHTYEDVLFFGYTPPDVLDDVKEFEVRDDDVFIATYPKAGTTWLQEITWLIMNNAHLDGAYRKQVYFRSPFLEFKDEELNEVGIEIANNMSSTRVIKTHLPVNLLPKQIHEKKCKILLLFRNPKDMCVSYYHFYRSSSSFGNFKGSWSEFLQMFTQGHVDHGSWFDYTKGWWDLKQRDNVHIMYFETMKTDLRSEVCRLSHFLGKNLPDVTIDNIVTHCEFKSMKINPMTNHLDVYSIDSKISPFLRKGTVGDWKTHFTVAQNEQFDKLHTDVLGHLDIPFQYTIWFIQSQI